MTRPSDPAQMPSEANLTELAHILATGYVRLRLKESSQKELDSSPDSMALCQRPSDGHKPVAGKESA